MKKRVHTNALTIEHRIRILDWLRANADNLPNLTAEEMTAECSESIGHSCSLTQLRDTAKAGRVRWAVKRKSSGWTANRNQRFDHIERRLDIIEKRLGIPLMEFPDDNEID